MPQSAILALVLPTEENTRPLHTLLYKYNTILVLLCYKASLQVRTLKFISLVILEYDG